MELASRQFHAGHLLAVLGVSIVAGFFIVLIDGMLIAPAERAILGAIPGATAPNVIAA